MALIAFQFYGKDLTRNAKDESFQTINNRFITRHMVDSLVVYAKTVEVYLNKDSLKLASNSELLNKELKKILKALITHFPMETLSN